MILHNFCEIHKNFLETLAKIHIAKPKNVCYNVDTKGREVQTNEKVSQKLCEGNKGIPKVENGQG